MVMLFHLQHCFGSATFNKSGLLRELWSETVSTDACSNYIAREVAEFKINVHWEKCLAKTEISQEKSPLLF